MGQFETDTADVPPFLIRAHTAMKSGQYAEAAEQLPQDAIRTVSQAVAKDPSRTDMLFSLAEIYLKSNSPDLAEQCYESILDFGPSAAASNSLGSLCQYSGRLTEAVRYQRQALDTRPDRPELAANLARALLEAGMMHEGLRLLQDAAARMPNNPQVHSNLLFRLHQAPDFDPHSMRERHIAWAKRHAPAHLARTDHSNHPDPDRKLRIGYVSPDFRRNSVAYFFESLLDGCDSSQVSNYGYANVEFPDAITERLAGKFNYYRNIYSTPDEAVAEQVLADDIDILVDLAGHTGDNRLGVFALKPAPIQLTYLGYPDTTGLSAIDYRLTDALADPPHLEDACTEELIRLPDGFLCYRPPEFAPNINQLPAQTNGCVTFASFNNGCKITPATVELWSAVLEAVPNSRIMLKVKGGLEPEIRQNYLDLFTARRIAAERIDIHGWTTPAEHLSLYGRADIALDTFPYNGTTTTCEALWMGLPVISLAAETHHMSRVGLSILKRLNLEFFAASSAPEYVAKAASLASNLPSLAAIRSGMRARIAISGLCHAKAFARQVEFAYRQVWRRWCSRRID